MNTRKWFTVSLLLLLSAGLVFAHDGKYDNDYPKGGWMFGEKMEFLAEESQTLEGTFSMVDGEYPALLSAEGVTYYLMLGFIADSQDLPEEGAAMKVEALKTPISPNTVMVISAEVDGEEWIMPYFADEEWHYHCPGAYGGRAGRRKGFGRYRR